jgi:acyl-coenzyme A synthetase/AMP-(fatty) acid ligase
VYPGDVERVLRQHPGVVDAAVAENERSGVAYVVLGAGSEADDQELMQFCREHLAMHEVPSAIVFVERLPRNSVGKLLRHELSR